MRIHTSYLSRFGHVLLQMRICSDQKDGWTTKKRGRKMDNYIRSWGYGARICLGNKNAQMIIQNCGCRSAPNRNLLGGCFFPILIEGVLSQLLRSFRFRSLQPGNPWHCENLAIMLYWNPFGFHQGVTSREKTRFDDVKNRTKAFSTE